MHKIKVLHIIKTLGLGGAEVNLFNLVNATDPARFEIHVAYSSGGEIEERFRKAGIRLFKFANDSHRLKSLASVSIILRLAGYIKKNQISIVHTHTFNAQVWGGLAGRLAGAKVIEHVHDFRYGDPDDFRRRRGVSNQYQYIKHVKDFADVTVVLTRQNREFLLNQKIKPANRIREFQNGIPLNPGNREDDARSALRQRFGLPDNALTILTPIRLAPEKNADLIIRIAPDVIKDVPNAYFLIAGDGPLLNETRDQIKQLHLENHVRLIGYHSDMTALLKGTDILLLPSFLELHSIAILEAMSMKVPVVISRDVGCNSEFIRDGHNGILLDPFKDTGWAQALIRLLQNPQVRQSIGEEGYRTCREQFDIRDTVKNFENLYVELARL